MNTFNLIFNLAQLKEFKHIQKLALCLHVSEWRRTEWRTHPEVGDSSSHGGQQFRKRAGNESRHRLGLGMIVHEDIERSGRKVSKGTFGWSGAYGCRFFIDPIRKITAVMMMAVSKYWRRRFSHSPGIGKRRMGTIFRIGEHFYDVQCILSWETLE